MVQLYPVGATSALKYAVQILQNSRIEIVDHPTPEVTHLLLDVPSFGNNGLLRGGGNIDKILETVPQYITVVGGNLDHPALDGYKVWDLLKEETYLAENAAITADCALRVAAPLLRTTFSQTPVLILGWGRIGKCLGRMLQTLGCDVTVAARSEKDRALLGALGFKPMDPGCWPELTSFRLIFNTVPYPILPAEKTARRKDCVKIDLASRQGIEGEDVVWARGLPRIHAPESSGKLIADTILRKIKEAKV
jgi:dipicolinate synthase subunit A